MSLHCMQMLFVRARKVYMYLDHFPLCHWSGNQQLNKQQATQKMEFCKTE